MTISLRTLLLIALAAVLGVAGYLAFVRADKAAPAASAGERAAAPVRALAPARAATAQPAAPDVPLGTVEGLDPGTRITLLSLRRSGPKVVTARLRIDFEGEASGSAWVPVGYDRDIYDAEDMRLVDEVNGREHFVLRNADGACLCSGEFSALDEGESSVISAKFPAPPANVTHASVETPGFPSFDGVPLS